MSCSLLSLTLTAPCPAENHPRRLLPNAGIRFHTRRWSHRLPHRFIREPESTAAWNPELSRAKKRCRFAPMATSMELPLLPFPSDEVFVPSETKTLHLYEARYLALLEESLTRRSKIFVHFVLDPIIVDDLSNEPSFAARYGCLALIENVERLEVGALVSIRGVGRVKIVKFIQAEPYLQGLVIPEQDGVPESSSKLSLKISEVKEALQSLNTIEIKLKAPKEALLQTQTANSLGWAEKEPSVNCDEAFIPSLGERLSFAGFQPVSGSTESERLKLQYKKLKAMKLKDTLQRLDESLALIKENTSIVAAKLAIQSLET